MVVLKITLIKEEVEMYLGIEGKWIKSFSIHIGTATNNMAKIWVVRYGLKIAWESGYKLINL